jgi:hypothetical protein
LSIHEQAVPAGNGSEVSDKAKQARSDDPYPLGVRIAPRLPRGTAVSPDDTDESSRNEEGQSYRSDADSNTAAARQNA